MPPRERDAHGDERDSDSRDTVAARARERPRRTGRGTAAPRHRRRPRASRRRAPRSPLGGEGGRACTRSSPKRRTAVASIAHGHLRVTHDKVRARVVARGARRAIVGGRAAGAAVHAHAAAGAVDDVALGDALSSSHARADAEPRAERVRRARARARGRRAEAERDRRVGREVDAVTEDRAVLLALGARAHAQPEVADRRADDSSAR